MFLRGKIMKRLLFVLFIAGVIANTGCISKTSHTIKPISYKKRLLVAVADLQNRTGNPEYDSLMVEGLTGSLIHELHGTECFRVIERQRLTAILEEMKLGMTGLLDPKKTKEVGRMLGVNAILFVNLASVRYDYNVDTVFPLAKAETEKIDVTLDARLVAVETGEVLATAKSSTRYENNFGTAIGFVKRGGKADQKSVVQVGMESSLKELAHEIAWQFSKNNP